MFTGLIQRVGTVKRVSRGRGLVLEFQFEPWPEPLVKGVRETEARTGLAELLPGARVNLERAIKAGERFGGHVVQGHVDGRGTLIKREQKGRDFALTFRCPRAIAAASVLKGSIAVNGVSLTVSGLGDDWLRVDVIPTTAAETNLGALRAGDRVNLESDVLGKYARRYAEGESEDGSEDGGLTMEMLEENGFA